MKVTSFLVWLGLMALAIRMFVDGGEWTNSPSIHQGVVAIGAFGIIFLLIWVATRWRWLFGRETASQLRRKADSVEQYRAAEAARLLEEIEDKGAI